jgi:hypothetical protein
VGGGVQAMTRFSRCEARLKIRFATADMTHDKIRFAAGQRIWHSTAAPLSRCAAQKITNPRCAKLQTCGASAFYEAPEGAPQSLVRSLRCEGRRSGGLCMEASEILTPSRKVRRTRGIAGESLQGVATGNRWSASRTRPVCAADS